MFTHRQRRQQQQQQRRRRRRRRRQHRERPPNPQHKAPENAFSPLSSTQIHHSSTARGKRIFLSAFSTSTVRFCCKDNFFLFTFSVWKVPPGICFLLSSPPSSLLPALPAPDASGLCDPTSTAIFIPWDKLSIGENYQIWTNTCSSSGEKKRKKKQWRHQKT